MGFIISVVTGYFIVVGIGFIYVALEGAWKGIKECRG